MDRSWFGVAFVLCLLLVPLVWGAQRLLNTFHPWQDVRRAQRVHAPLALLLMLLMLVWLGVATVLAAFPFSFVLSLQGWTHQLSARARFWMLSVAVLASGALIATAAGLCARRWAHRRRRGTAAPFSRRRR